MGKKKEKLTLALVLGTSREGRISEGIAHFIKEEVEKHKIFKAVLVDVKEYPHTKTARVSRKEEGALAQNWSTIAQSAHAFLFVVPEYNRGYPGEFKLLLDALHDEYHHKPALVCGVSNGRFGGVRVAEHLKPVMLDLGMVLLSKSLAVFHAPTFFEAVRAVDREDFVKALQRSLEELYWFARRLA
jgi:NAD(P)H-dependent FMN reductase